MAARNPGTMSRPTSAVTRSPSEVAPELRAMPAEMQWADDSGVVDGLKEAVLALLERRPENPMLFLAAYFNDRVSASSSMSRAMHFVCLEASTRTELMDNLSSAYSILEEAAGSGSAGTAGVRGVQFNRLILRLVGTEHPQTAKCLMKVFEQPTDSFVSFSDFQIGMQMGLLIRKLAAHALDASDRIFYKEGPKGLEGHRLPRHTFLDTVNSFVHRRRNSAQTSREVMDGDKAGDVGHLPEETFVDIDTFMRNLMAVVTSVLATSR